MYARILHRRLLSSTRESVSSLMANLKEPDPRKIKGLHAYYVLDTGENQWATIAIFDSKKALDEWTKECVRVLGKSAVASKFSKSPHDLSILAGNVKLAYPSVGH